MGANETEVKSGAWTRPRAKTVVLIILAFVAIAGVAALPWVQKHQAGRGLTRQKADMRTLAIAIENYYIDCCAYPAWSADPALNAYGGIKPEERAAFDRVPTFMMQHGSRLMTLTTPVAYLKANPADLNSPAPGQTFAFWEGTGDYILWGAGPDRVFNLTLDSLPEGVDPRGGKWLEHLNGLIYDPTNGTQSSGDVIRFGHQGEVLAAPDAAKP